MARYIIVYKDNEQLESTLHIDKCPNRGQFGYRKLLYVKVVF